MKKSILVLSFIFYSIVAFSQDTLPKQDTIKYWKYGGTIGIAAQQVSLTNWAAGGQNSISGSGLLSLFLNYSKAKLSWNNNLDLAYGVIKQGDNKNWWKNDDRIQFTSKVGLKAIKKWNYTLLLDFKSQFAPGYNYPNDSVCISDFIAPAYGLASLGMDYQPNDNFSFYISPITAKITMVYNQKLADAGAFGVKNAEYGVDNAGTIILLTAGENIRAEYGAYAKMLLKRNVMENVTFATQLELFTNYSYKPGNIDVNWTTLTTLKVNKYISATLSTHLIYDDDIQINTGKLKPDGTADIGPRTQFKQVLAVGFSYKF